MGVAEAARDGAGEPPPEARRPLDLCVVRPTLGQGGADRITLTLLEVLDRARFRPSLILLRRQGEWLSRVPADVPIHDLGGRRLWTAWWPLARLLRRLSPQIVLSTSSGANLVAALGHRLAGRPGRLVLSERNVLERPVDGGPKRRLQLWLKRRLYPLADCVTAVSRGVADDLELRLGLAAHRLRVVYNPVVTPDMAALAAAEPPHPWLAADDPVVLGVGRLVAAKGFDTLIEALALSRAAPAPRLLILGEGPLRRALAARAQRLGLSDRVDFAGFDPNPFRFMARSTLFVLASRHEGLPGALIQAMACGCPVVATDCHAGPAEIVEDGVSGLLTPVDDAPAMAARIDRLLADGGLRDRMATRARRAVVARFSLDAVMQRYLEALDPTAPDEPRLRGT